MHAHSILMLAAVGIVAAFVPIVLAVRWLESRGYIGDQERPVPFREYGVVIAGAFSAGSAAIHLSVIGDHAIETATTGGDPVLFLCSVGVATAHVTSMDSAVAGFVPVGVATIVIGPAQAAWIVPALWRRVRLAFVGLAIAIGSFVVGLSQVLSGPALPSAQASTTSAVGSTVLIGQGVLLIAVAVLVIGRPRRLIERLEARSADAYVAIGLALATVAILTGVAIGVDHLPH